MQPVTIMLEVYWLLINCWYMLLVLNKYLFHSQIQLKLKIKGKTVCTIFITAVLKDSGEQLTILVINFHCMEKHLEENCNLASSLIPEATAVRLERWLSAPPPYIDMKWLDGTSSSYAPCSICITAGTLESLLVIVFHVNQDSVCLSSGFSNAGSVQMWCNGIYISRGLWHVPLYKLEQSCLWPGGGHCKPYQKKLLVRVGVV